MKHNPSSLFTRVPQTVFVSVFFRLQIIYHCYRNRSINLGSTYGIYNTEARPVGSCNRTSSFHSVQFGWRWNSPITCGFFSHDHICAAFVLRRVVVYFVKLISPWTKWSSFRRRSFQMYCLNCMGSDRTYAIWRCRKPFNQWQRNFLMKASIPLGLLISPWRKWPLFRRQHFQMHFHEWKVLYFY